jgi:hypothetical protein
LPLDLSISVNKQVLDFLQQKRFIRKFTGFPFGINSLPVDLDLEHPSARFDEHDVGVRLVPDPVRQTGGPVPVASLVAVFDGDVHGLAPWQAK